MGDIEKGRIDKPRDEGVVSSRIGSDKKEEAPYVQLPSSSVKRILAATFLNTLKNLFSAFSSTGEEGSLANRIIDQRTVLETLLNFQKLLKQLGEKDLSQDAAFAQELSERWLKIKEDFNKLQIIERKGSNKAASFRRAIDAINHYPPGADHSFGYYLLEQAGRDWLPFPFIEILLNLHLEHKRKGEGSSLSHWIYLIEEVNKELRGKAPPIS
jgi:hypothetical protein